MSTTSSSEYGVPVVSRPGERETVEYYATTLEIALRAEDTGGGYFVIATEMGPADAPPFHVHTREDELWVVESGRFRWWIGGDSLDAARVEDVGPGAVVYAPRGVPHTFQSLDEGGRVVQLIGPGASQSYWLELGSAPSREDFEHPERLDAIGVRVLDRAPVDGA